MKLKIGGYTLCAPTYLYLILSALSFIMMVASNVGGAVIMFFIIKVLIWVLLLNLMCANGLVGLAWFFVLLPFIVMFIYIITYGAMDSYRLDYGIYNEEKPQQQVKPTVKIQNITNKPNM